MTNASGAMVPDPNALWGSSEYEPTAQRLAPVAPILTQLARAAVPPPAKVLEIGAGHGELATRLCGCGYDVVALEPTRRMREVGRRRTPSGVAWVDRTAESTGLQGESVDLVVSSFGLMFADPSAGVGEMARVLRPGGRLIMTAWAPRGFLHEMTCRMITVLPQLAGSPHLAWGDPGAARDRLRRYFGEIAVDERRLPWRFGSISEAMTMYRTGSPTHAASLALAGERRDDLERALEDHLREQLRTDGTVDASASYVTISATR